MPVVDLLKWYFIGTALSILAAIYGIVDSVGGLMYTKAEYHWTSSDCTAMDVSVPRIRNKATKHIGLK